MTEPRPHVDGVERFDFAFSPRARVALAGCGVTPARAWVEIGGERLQVRFGPWWVDTPITNVRDVCVTGPYRWWRAVGARGSFVDRGATFGSNTRAGVCIRFHRPVRALAPTDRVRHPGLTVTVAEPARCAAVLRERAEVGETPPTERG